MQKDTERLIMPRAQFSKADMEQFKDGLYLTTDSDGMAFLCQIQMNTNRLQVKRA